jgi:hypothetical protein
MLHLYQYHIGGRLGSCRSVLRGDYGPFTHVNTTFSETGVTAGCPWLLSLCNCATLPLL